MFGIYPPIELILSWSQEAREKLERRRRYRELDQEASERAEATNRGRRDSPESGQPAQRSTERKAS